MSEGVVVVVAVIAAATAFGLWRRLRDGRLRAPKRAPVAGEAVLTAADIGGPLGERVTFVQFSSPLCQPCRVTHRTLHGVSADVPGAVHVDLDAPSRMDLVRRLGITRTPTVLVLDAGGRVVRRATGALTVPEVRQNLAELGV